MSNSDINSIIWLWTLTKTLEKRMETMEKRCFRRLLAISRIAHRSDKTNWIAWATPGNCKKGAMSQACIETSRHPFTWYPSRVGKRNAPEDGQRQTG